MKTVRQFFNNTEAELARMRLADAGIDAVLAEEHTNTLGPGYAPGGVRLQVPDEDAERALEILDGAEDAAPLTDDFVPPGEPETVPPRLEGFDVMRGLVPACVGVLAVFGVICALWMHFAPLEWTHSPRDLSHLGYVALENKEYAKALKYFDAGVKAEPQNPKFYDGRAYAFLKLRDYRRTIEDCSTAISLFSPGVRQARCYRLRSLAFIRTGKTREALNDLEQALQLNSGDEKAYCRRGEVYLKIGEYGKALDDFKRAVKLAPEWWGGYDDLAWFYATCPVAELRNGPKAVELAWKACEMTEWKDAYCLGTLAAAEAEMGLFDEALRYQQQALSMAQADGRADDRLLKKMRDALASYQQKKPYRETPKT